MSTATLADLQALERLISALPAEKRKALAEMPAVKARLGKWQPNPGAQAEAYYCKADCLLYGGQPGGGKSSLILGLAFNEHKRSFIMRREYGDLERLIEDALKINGTREGFNGSPPPRLRTADGRLVYFRAAHRVGDEQGTMGQGHCAALTIVLAVVGYSERALEREADGGMIVDLGKAKDEGVVVESDHALGSLKLRPAGIVASEA